MKKYEEENEIIEVDEDTEATEEEEVVEEQPKKKKSWWKIALAAVGGVVVGSIATGLCMSKNNDSDDGESLLGLEVDDGDVIDVEVTEF